MKSVGIPNEPDVMKPDATTVFYFPQKAPEGAMVRRDLTAIEHLEIWKKFQDLWCEHKPSITVNVRESEWMGVGGWVFDNFKSVSGVAFLPMDDHSYVQAPYQELTEEQYNEWMAKMPTEKIDWSQLSKFEMVDTTSSSQELACSGGVCEVVEIGKVT
jgi:ribonucleoside-diphosphate reductase alpha chain